MSNPTTAGHPVGHTPGPEQAITEALAFFEARNLEAGDMEAQRVAGVLRAAIGISAEMLEALRRTVGWLEVLEALVRRDERKSVNAVYDQVRAAIAKAEASNV